MSVYFARIKGYVKIGFSAKPYERIGTIATGSCIKPNDVNYGDPVDLFGWIPGDRHTEKSMHRAFGELAVTGEWFWDDDAYDELIEAHPFGVPFYDTSIDVWLAMEEYPNIPRALVIETLDKVKAEELADPTSTRAQVVSFFGDMTDWSASQSKRLADERAADRAYWRSMRLTQQEIAS